MFCLVGSCARSVEPATFEDTCPSLEVQPCELPGGVKREPEDPSQRVSKKAKPEVSPAKPLAVKSPSQQSPVFTPPPKHGNAWTPSPPMSKLATPTKTPAPSARKPTCGVKRELPISCQKDLVRGLREVAVPKPSSRFVKSEHAPALPGSAPVPTAMAKPAGPPVPISSAPPMAQLALPLAVPKPPPAKRARDNTPDSEASGEIIDLDQESPSLTPTLLEFEPEAAPNGMEQHREVADPAEALASGGVGRNAVLPKQGDAELGPVAPASRVEQHKEVAEPAEAPASGEVGSNEVLSKQGEYPTDLPDGVRGQFEERAMERVDQEQVEKQCTAVPKHELYQMFLETEVGGGSHAKFGEHDEVAELAHFYCFLDIYEKHCGPAKPILATPPQRPKSILRKVTFAEPPTKAPATATASQPEAMPVTAKTPIPAKASETAAPPIPAKASQPVKARVPAKASQAVTAPVPAKASAPVATRPASASGDNSALDIQVDQSVSCMFHFVVLRD